MSVAAKPAFLAAFGPARPVLSGPASPAQAIAPERGRHLLLPSAPDCNGVPCQAAGSILSAATALLVSAPVGQTAMHSPQDTHVLSPMGVSRSNAMRVS